MVTRQMLEAARTRVYASKTNDDIDFILETKKKRKKDSRIRKTYDCKSKKGDEYEYEQINKPQPRKNVIVKYTKLEVMYDNVLLDTTNKDYVMMVDCSIERAIAAVRKFRRRNPFERHGIATVACYMREDGVNAPCIKMRRGHFYSEV